MVSGPPSGSDDPLLTSAFAVQLESAGTVTFWQTAIGGWFGVSQAVQSPLTDSV
jgi:hypothetical protein